MRLPGIHLDVKRRSGRMNASISLPASIPQGARPADGSPIYAIMPPALPRQLDPGTETGVYPSWVASGGTILPYTLTTHTPALMDPVLGPPLLHPLTPFNPLLMLGFGLNLLLLAGEVLNVDGEVGDISGAV
jgi:hypothetical protein